MLEHFTLRTAIATIFFAATIKCVPFKLTSSKKLLTESLKTRKEVWLWYLATFSIFCHGLFQIFSFSLNVWTNGLTKDSAPHFFFLTVALFSMLFYGNAFWKPNETVYHINCISILMEENTWTTRNWYALPFCVATVNYFSILASLLWPLLLVLLFIVNPDGHMFLCWILPDWIKSHAGVYELVLVIQTLINFWGCTMEGAAFCWWSANVFQNLIWLQDLIRNQRVLEQGTLYMGYQKMWQNAMDEYRKLQLLLSINNDLNAELTAGFEAVTCIVTVMMLYGTIVGYHVLHPLVYILFPASATFAVIIQTAFYAQISLWEIKSEEFIQLLGQNAVARTSRLDSKYMRSQLNRLVPLRCKLSFVGTFSLDMSHGCMTLTFSLLLLILSP